MATRKADSAKQYERHKDFKGQEYTGMKVGGTHKWNYDPGEWRERKVTPDDWKIYYKTTKRRVGKAPDESGVPVGTEYNWLIIAHQRVDKLDSNSYMTCMEGRKFKVAHKRAIKNSWNLGEKAQRKRVIQYLQQLIAELEALDENAMTTWTVGEQERVYGLELRNVNELEDMAKELGIPGRSKMKREPLLAAIKARLYGRSTADVVALNRLARDDRRVLRKAA